MNVEPSAEDLQEDDALCAALPGAPDCPTAQAAEAMRSSPANTAAHWRTSTWATRLLARISSLYHSHVFIARFGNTSEANRLQPARTHLRPIVNAVALSPKGLRAVDKNGPSNRSGNPISDAAGSGKTARQRKVSILPVSEPVRIALLYLSIENPLRGSAQR